MDNDRARKFINSIIKNLQLLCHSDVNFNENIEIIGHLYLNVDSNSKYNYFVNEKVCKNDESSTIFVSNSFHAEPLKKTGVNDKQDGAVNTDPKPIKFFEGRLKRNKRSNNSVLQNTFSDNNLCPTKQSRSDFPVVDHFHDISEIGYKQTGITQNQFDASNTDNSLSFSPRNDISVQSDCEIDQGDYQNEDSCANLPCNFLRNFDKQNSQNCTIDLTTVKCEPGTDEVMEYTKGQIKILEQTGDESYTDKQNLSNYSNSSDQMYTSAVHHDDIQNTSHLSSKDHSGIAGNSPQKSTFPPVLPLSFQGSASVGSQEGGINVSGRFQCPLCEKSFSFKTNAHRHVKEKHFPSKVHCPICYKAFSRQGTLNDHMIHCDKNS